MDREWRMSDRHVVDLQAAVDWTKTQWPLAKTWVLGLNNGALSAAVATASIDDLAGAVLLWLCRGGIRPAAEVRPDARAGRATPPRRQPVVRDAGAYAGPQDAGDRARRARASTRRGLMRDAANRPQFSGKDFQVVDVVARWILTGTAPEEIR